MQPSRRTEDFLVLEECRTFIDHGGQGEGRSCCLKSLETTTHLKDKLDIKNERQMKVNRREAGHAPTDLLTRNRSSLLKGARCAEQEY